MRAKSAGFKLGQTVKLSSQPNRPTPINQPQTMSLAPTEQHSLNQATLASVESSLSSAQPAPSSASASSSSSRPPNTNFTHSPGANPLLQRGKLKKAPAKKKNNKAKPASAPVPQSQLANAVEHAQEEELALLDQPGVNQEEAGEVIDLADELLAQLNAGAGSGPSSSTVPEEAVDASGTVSPKEAHHEHHSSLGEQIKGIGHDVKEAVKEVGTSGGDKRPNRQQARKVSTLSPYRHSLANQPWPSTPALTRSLGWPFSCASRMGSPRPRLRPGLRWRLKTTSQSRMSALRSRPDATN